MFIGIHYLRGFSAVSVAAYHTVPSVVRGDAGVDVFFVISGFVMVVCAEQHNVSARHFLEQRARRILPLWWIALGCYLIAPFGRHVDIDRVVSAALLIPYFDPKNELFVAYNVGWTLAFEVFFYLVFAASMWVGSFWLAIVAIVCTAALAPIGVDVFYANTCVLEFAAGMVIAKYLARPPPWVAAALPLGVACWLYGPSIDGPFSPMRALVYGGPATLVVVGVLAIERKIPKIYAASFLGSASYSIYLFHMIAALMVAEFLQMSSPWYPSVALTAGVTLGAVAHIAIERPILGAISRKPRRAAP